MEITAKDAARILLDAGESTSCAVAELMVLRDLDRATAEETVREVTLERSTMVRRLRRWAPRRAREQSVLSISRP